MGAGLKKKWVGKVVPSRGKQEVNGGDIRLKKVPSGLKTRGFSLGPLEKTGETTSPEPDPRATDQLHTERGRTCPLRFPVET